VSGGAFTIGEGQAADAVAVAAGEYDHGASALANLVEQFKDKPNIVAWLTLLMVPIQELETVLGVLLYQRTIDTAVGVQLTSLGKIVGQARDGVTDDAAFRRYVRARVAANRSSGLTSDLIHVTRLVIDDATVGVEVDPQNYATVVVKLSGAVPAPVAAILVSYLRRAAAAGVRLIVETASVVDNLAFTFLDGPGLGFGDTTDAAVGGLFADALT